MNIDKEFAEKALELVKSTGQFVLDQSNDLFKQMVQFEIYSNMVWIAVCLIAAIFAGYQIKKVLKEDFEDFHIAVYILGGTIFIFSSIGFVVNILDLLKAETAPKVFLIERLGQIAKRK